MKNTKNKKQEQQQQQKEEVQKEEDNVLLKTRICIKNLPKHYMENELRTFIYDRMKDNNVIVTDCKVLKNNNNNNSRRIAFIGFQSNKYAKQCIQLLHNTYCVTSKLIVEYATSTIKNNSNINSDKKDAEKNKDTTTTNIKKEQESLEKKKNTNIKNANKKNNTFFWANDDDNDYSNVDITTTTTNTTDDTTTDDVVVVEGKDKDSQKQQQSKKEKQNSAKQSAMDFLKSKIVPKQDLEITNTNNDNDGDNKQEKKKVNDDDENDINDEIVPMKSGNNNGVSTNNTNENTDDNIILNNRLFIRNLPYTATEDDVKEYLEEQINKKNSNNNNNNNIITECYIPLDDNEQSKGYAFVTCHNINIAKQIIQMLDKTDFQGRLLHIIPAKPKPNNQQQNIKTSLSYKDQKLQQLKQQQQQQQANNINSNNKLLTNVRDDAVLDNIAIRLGLQKGTDVLNVKDTLSSGDAAVRLALGETAIIQENINYFQQYNININNILIKPDNNTDNNTKNTTIKGKQNNNSAKSFIVKNLPFDTTKDELQQMFINAKEILLPPSKTIAIIQYEHSNDAKYAFRKYSYKKFKSVPLYLQWTPLNAFINNDNDENNSDNKKRKHSDLDSKEKELVEEKQEIDNNIVDEEIEESLPINSPTVSLYVKNLNFVTTEEQLHEYFSKHTSAKGNVCSVRIPKKVTVNSKELSMGYGFVEVISKDIAKELIKKLNGTILHEHSIQIQFSTIKSTSDNNKSVLKDKQQQQNKNKKLLIRNVPFQATRTELLKLFGTFGQLKKVRLPKKYGNIGHRGFAFIEYNNSKDAINALNTLSQTHLYGRHLVIEWATNDDDDDDDNNNNNNNLHNLREKAKHDIIINNNNVTAQPKGKKIRF